jgi:hypothetical protein
VDLSSTGEGPVAGSCECGNELFGSIKGKELLHHLCDYYLFKDFVS